MNKIIEQSIEYLEKKYGNIYQEYKEKQLLEMASPTSFPNQEKDKMLNLINHYITRDRAFTYGLLPTLNFCPEIYDLQLMDEYKNYFKDEKKCLLSIRKLLKKDTLVLTNGSLANSTYGLLLSTITDIHTANSNNLHVAINYYECRHYSKLNLGINKEAIIPRDTTLVKEMIKPLKEELKQQKMLSKKYL